MNEELLYQATVLQQESEKIQEHLDAIEKQLSELSQLSGYLSHLNTTEEKEIIASLGKGIHIKANLAEKKLFVEVGSGIVVRKTPEQTIEVIGSQLKKLREFKAHLSGQKDICSRALNEAMTEIRKEGNKAAE